mgnify:CR=1 FL=1
MKKLFVLLLLFAVSQSQAQVKDPFPYKFSSSIYENIKSDSNSWRGGKTSSDLSFIGLYKEALQEWDKARPYKRKVSREDSIDFVKTYKPVDARTFILKKAKENRVIIFNEAHYNPRHRVFVTSLLEDLKKAGFTHFAAETFSTRPAFKENSQYPNLNTGYYSMEPQFGNLIREANRLNYSLYPYEQSSGGQQQQRETGQAKNLARLLDSLPGSKVIVYCGFAHIGEYPIEGWAIPMAAMLKELTGIDPYTIDQTVLAERSRGDLDHPYFTIADVKKYAIFTDKKGNPFNKKLDDKKVNAFLFAPATNYIHNRPDWIFENGKKAFFLNKDSVNVSYPFLAKVYFKETDIENIVIPADMMEIRSPQELAETALAVFKKRKFIVQLIDTEGKTQVIKP